MGQGRRSGLLWIVPQRRERVVGVEPPVERAPGRTRRAVRSRRGRPDRSHAKRVAPLARERSERDLDERRGRRDLDAGEPERVGEREHSLLELGSRVAGLVPGACELDQQLRGRVREPVSQGVSSCRWPRLAARRRPNRTVGAAPSPGAAACGLSRVSRPSRGRPREASSRRWRRTSRERCEACRPRRIRARRGRRHPDQDDGGSRPGLRPPPVAREPDEQEDDERAGAADRRDRGEVDEVRQHEATIPVTIRPPCLPSRDSGPSRGGNCSIFASEAVRPAAPKSVPFVAPAVAISAATAISVKPASPSAAVRPRRSPSRRSRSPRRR